MTKEEEHWRKNWRTADMVWGHESVIGEERLKRRARMLIEMGKVKKGVKVLELGCGTGKYTEILAKTGCSLTATDLMKEFVQVSKRRVKGIKVLQADGTKLPFKDGVFEAVVGNSVLHHMPIKLVLKEVCRVLKPGGWMAFTEPNMLNPHILLQKNVPILKKMAGDTPSETAFVRWKVIGELKKQGFVSVRVEPFDFVYPFLPEAMMGKMILFGQIAERVPVLREIGGSVVISSQKPELSKS